MLMPALLTTTSTRPKRCSTSAITRSHSSRDEMSAGTAIEAAAYWRHWSTISSSLSLRRATAATVTPLRARSVATVAPIPDDAPVTTATRPASSKPASSDLSSARRLEGPYAGGRGLLRTAGAEEVTLAHHDHSGVTRRRQRHRVDQHAVPGIPNLQGSGDARAHERHPTRQRRRPEGLRGVPLPVDGARRRVEGVDARLLHETVVGDWERAPHRAESFEATEVAEGSRPR